MSTDAANCLSVRPTTSPSELLDAIKSPNKTNNSVYGRDKSLRQGITDLPIIIPTATRFTIVMRL